MYEKELSQKGEEDGEDLPDFYSMHRKVKEMAVSRVKKI